MTKDIFYAALRGNATALVELLDSGIEPNIKNELGCTPLMAAAHDGRTECIRILISRGANVNASDKSGFTALSNSIQHSTMETTCLLIENNADINHITQSGFSPLMFVPYNNYPVTDKIELAKYLLGKGADINAKDDSGLTALDHAKKKDCQYLYEALSC
ncbi:ankyrin repeat domain-containing protein [Marinomonas sp. PE14-40]|uniref:ankyrin repeat domain-containing protein n=1 Tax=Marinomonas sp. PE14-40 TaxID=3060621 RepID=UPI003F678100